MVKVKAESLQTSSISPIHKIHDIKKQNLIQNYKDFNGHITNACAATGIERKTYYNWMEKDSDFAEAILECEADLNDEIRNVLVTKAAEGDMTAVIFYLKNRHPDFKQVPQTQNNVQVNLFKKVVENADRFMVNVQDATN